MNELKINRSCLMYIRFFAFNLDLKRSDKYSVRNYSYTKVHKIYRWYVVTDAT